MITLSSNYFNDVGYLQSLAIPSGIYSRVEISCFFVYNISKYRFAMAIRQVKAVGVIQLGGVLDLPIEFILRCQF